tara:strand:+ start:721 stop:984 length:264 start_codon:yes stop_codon:yes gene_type:complete
MKKYNKKGGSKKYIKPEFIVIGFLVLLGLMIYFSKKNNQSSSVELVDDSELIESLDFPSVPQGLPEVLTNSNIDDISFLNPDIWNKN